MVTESDAAGGVGKLLRMRLLNFMCSQTPALNIIVRQFDINLFG